MVARRDLKILRFDLIGISLRTLAHDGRISRGAPKLGHRSVDDCWRVSKRYWARGMHSAQARSLAVHDYSNNNEKGKYEPQKVGSHYDFIFVN